MKKDKFIITCPPGTVYLVLAVGIVHNWKVAGLLLAFLFLLGTILENRK